MATQPSITRRAAFAAAALPAIIATPVIAEEISPSEARRLSRRAFIDQCGNLHRNGRLSATRAMSMGIDPDLCIGIQLYSRNNPEWMPQLHFEAPDNPGERVVVGPSYAYRQRVVL